MPLNQLNLPEVGRSIQLIGAVYADSHEAWMVLLPNTGVTVAATPVNLTADEWATFLRQTDLVEFEATVEDENGKPKRAIIRKSSRQVSQHFSWEVFRRDEFKCRYCGKDDVPITVDHLVTWESGGPSIPENLVASCSKCNNARGEMEFTAWLMDPYYKRVSSNLTHTVKFANQALIPTLAKIPRIPLKEGKKRKR